MWDVHRCKVQCTGVWIQEGGLSYMLYIHLDLTHYNTVHLFPIPFSSGHIRVLDGVDSALYLLV